MFESLKEKIKENKSFEPPNLANFYDTIALIENCVPAIWRKRRKSYTQKAARILFYRDVTSRDVKSSRDLWGQELWLIHEWFSGQSGAFSQGDDPDWQKINKDLNWQEFMAWCYENADGIRAYAEIVGQAVRAMSKSKRKSSNTKVPF